MALAVDGSASGFPAIAEVAAWLEALGVRAWIPGRSNDPPRADEVTAALSGIAIPAVRHLLGGGAAAAAEDPDRCGRPLTAAAPHSRERAVERLIATAVWAVSARAPWVIVETGAAEPFPAAGDERALRRERDERLDRLCRSLHAAAARAPEAGFALATPRDAQPWLTPVALEQAFEELTPRRRFAYWHDAGRAQAFAARGFCPAAEWIDRHGSRCIGLDATDAVADQGGLPAGAGEVDFPALLGAVGASTWIALRSEPFSGPGPLLAALRHLRGAA